MFAVATDLVVGSSVVDISGISSAHTRLIPVPVTPARPPVSIRIAARSNPRAVTEAVEVAVAAIVAVVVAEAVAVDRTPALRTAALATSRGSNEYQPHYLPQSDVGAGLDSDPCTGSVIPVGGRLRFFWRKWQLLGASKRVVRWLRLGYPLPFRLDHRGLPVTPPLLVHPPPNLVTFYQDPVKQGHLDRMLDELVTKHAIQEIPHTDPAYFSRVFLVPKKNGKLRLILDLSALNHWLVCPTFRMDHAQVVRDALAPDMWATSIDLSDAYLHIPILSAHCKFLVFQVGNRRFQWLVLPFGLNTAPRITRQECAEFRVIRSLVGLLTATEKIVPYGRLHFRELQRFCNSLVMKNTPRRVRVYVPSVVLHDLDWWSDHDRVFRGLQMSRHIPDLQIQTDASTTGWGANFQGQVLSGTWTPAEQRLHINVLEMKAVLLTCQRLLPHLRQKCCLFLIDNQTVVSYLQKQGGTRSLQLMQLTREVLLLAEQELFLIQAQHIKGNLNVIADLASRTGYVVNTEWALSSEAFHRIQQLSPWGPAVIDLFANQLNHRLPLYFSPCPDPLAMSVNALITQWPAVQTIYAFPPTTIMDRVLQKIIRERPQHLLLVAPLLLDAQWFPLLQQLPCEMSVPLELRLGDLRQPHWDHWHPNPSLFNLHLWCISFRP